MTLTLEDEIDIARGDLLARPAAHAPKFADQFAAHLDLDERTIRLIPGRSYLLKIGTRTVPATVTALKHRIDVDTLRASARHDAGSERDRLLQPLDRGAGGVRSLRGQSRHRRLHPDRPLHQRDRGGRDDRFGLRRASNIHWQALTVDARAARRA